MRAAALLLCAMVACAAKREETPAPVVVVGRPTPSAIATSAPDAGAIAIADAAPEASPRAVCDPKAVTGCNYEKQACVDGACVDCPQGTEPITIACARYCHLDEDCGKSEICSYLTPAYSFCMPKPPTPICKKGQIALKTGTCFTPCQMDSDCTKIDPNLCCRGDPNSPVPICMGKC
jgi:hypothetical protein